MDAEPVTLEPIDVAGVAKLVAEKSSTARSERSIRWK